MVRIDKLPARYPVPARCAITKRTEDPQGFVACGALPEPTDEIFLSVSGLREAGRKIGMATPEEVAALREEIDSLTVQLREAAPAAEAWRAYVNAEKVPA